MKKSSSPGDSAGTFQGNIEHLPENRAEGSRKKVDVSCITRRNILTSPGKCGGPGISGTLIGGKNIEYISSDYDAYEKALKKDRVLHRERMGDRRPFTSTTRRREFFDYGVFADPGAANRKPKEHTHKREPCDFKVFRPSSPPKSGYNGTLSPFPESMPEQFDDRERRLALLPMRRHPFKEAFKAIPDNLRERKPFRPTTGPRSSVVKPISTMRLRA